MSAAPLPAVEQWLSALVPRVRALRVAHGTSRLIAAALGAASFILLLDAGLGLAPWVRGLFLSVWLTAVGVLAWRWVLIPWRGALPLSEVASEVGKRWPELGERLRVAVARAPSAEQTADAAKLIGAVDGAEAVPVRPVVGFASGALAAVVVVVATAVLTPGSAERLRRVAAPWAKSAAGSYRVVVTSGEPVVRRGGPVTLAAYAERIPGTPHAAPDAVLVTRGAPGAAETRTPMAADGLSFHATRAAVAADFEYCVEVGGGRSGWHRVFALAAVELAPGTAIEIAPPDYARSGPPRVLPTLTDFEGLQFGAVAFRLKFTLPAATGHLDWRPDGATKSELIALEFAPDQMGATAFLPLRCDGVLKLVLVREAGGKRLRTDTVARVRARADAPPRFETLTGVSTRPRTVTPDTRVPITFVATDDWAVAKVELHYVVGSDESRAVVVPLAPSGAGTPRAAGRCDFDLSDKARAGDVVRFRVVATDGRSVEAEKLGPQAVVYPRTGWSELRVAATAPPLAEQDIACARDALADALAAARKDVQDAGAEAAAVQTAAAGVESLPLDLTSRLGTARGQVQDAREALRVAAADAALYPDARALAAATDAIGPLLVAAEGALHRGETDAPAARSEALKAAGEFLRDADTKLNELAVQNTRHARTRLDRIRLVALREDQVALASAAAGPDVAARQRKLLDRFLALVAESDVLQTAYDGAKADELRRLLGELAELTAHLRELDAAAKQTAADTRASLVAGVAREQEAIVRLAAARFARLETATRLAGTAPPPTADLARVADHLAAGNALPALAALEQYAQAFAQLAGTFDKLAAERADPRLAARHLAHWQNDLLDRYRAAAKAGGFAALPDEAKAVFRAEQSALAAMTAALALPPDEPVKAAHADARRHTELAREFLARDGAGAEDAMKAAVRALGLVFERTPPLGERYNKARNELEKVRSEFETHGSAVEKALREFERQPEALAKRLAALAPNPRKFATAIAALDLSGLSERQARVGAVLKTAADDLRDGLPQDVMASQLAGRRELERLKQVLEGVPPPDLKADELVRKLAAAADQFDATGVSADALTAVQEVGRQLASLTAPDVQVSLNDARVAVQAAESALRDPKPDAPTRVRAAADALNRLCERLHGVESDWARVKRLGVLRRAAAANPKELLTSEEALKQLGRESEELTRTRVGADGQMLKKRALDLYSKLRAKADPDRVGTDLKTLAAVLDELAAKMADVIELTAGAPRPAAPAPPADYLPTRAHADALRELEKRVRALHAQVANLPAEHATRLRSAAANPLAALEFEQSAVARDALALTKELTSAAAGRGATAAASAAKELRVGRTGPAKADADHAANFFRQLATEGTGKPWAARAADLVARQDALRITLEKWADRSDLAAARQIARTAELGRLTAEFAARLERTAATFDPGAAKPLVAAATAAREAEKQLAEAARKHADEFAFVAPPRTAALDALRAATEALGTPAGTTSERGELLRATERAMRAARPGDAADALKRLERE